MAKAGRKPLVAIDSNALVFGVLLLSASGTHKHDADLVQRAKWLFEKLDREEAQIIVPAIVVAEYLSHVEQRRHAEMIELMRARFVLPSFDVKSASLAAELFNHGQASRANKGSPNGRKVLRADSLIVATAKTQGARVFYSHDENCRAMAERAKMDAFDLPTMPEELFEQ